MSCWNLQEDAFSALPEMRGGFVYLADPKDPVVCPKPRRLGVLRSIPIKPLRQMSHQADLCDSKASKELLDLIFVKDGYGKEQSSVAQVVSSPPPFFSGSPPTRASNPLIRDARFGNEKFSPSSVLQPSSPSSLSLSSSARKGGCARMKFGLKPAAVRVEGFDCLNRDCQNSGIPAVA